jgi:hypothetical protein
MMRLGDLAGSAGVLARTFGARGVARRASFELRRRGGRFRAAPGEVTGVVLDAPLPERWPFVPDAERVRAASPHATALRRAERVAAGEHEAYRWLWRPLPLRPADWNVHPASGFAYDAAAPWWRIAHFHAAAGDIKDAWEPGRFAWSYDLARGWLLTGDDRFAAAFWSRLESFVAGCPPFRGVQWACGQETAIRAIALLWTEGALLDAPSTTPARLGLLRRVLAWSAERIDDAIDYALSQRNNHGLSEAAGLVAIGARLRGADKRAVRWLRRGAALLDEQAPDQIAPDGWYIQHSFTYARVALDQLVVAQRALAGIGESLAPATVERARALVGMLGAVTDPVTGDPPLHGANDGAFVLPLSTRGYRDFVPALTAGAATFGAELPAGMSPDAETLAWLGAREPRVAPERPAVARGESGWVVAESEGARLFARAGRYGSRPGHIDPLHVDIWIRGVAVATDAGTYRYAAPAPWANGLAAMEVHNTLTLPARPAARRGPRFLWLSWPEARVVHAEALDGGRIRVVLENRSWLSEGILHRRTCELSGAGATVLDVITAPRELELPVVLHWLLDGSSDEIAVAATAPIARSEARGEEGDVRGWISERYAQRRAATSVRIESRVAGGVLRIVTGFGDRRAPELLQLILRGEAGETATCST